MDGSVISLSLPTSRNAVEIINRVVVGINAAVRGNAELGKLESWA
jgi:hypothetical protein